MKRVAIQGIRGSFHDIIARHYFSQEAIQTVECHSFDDLCHTLKNDGADLAIMAIENTLAGSILPNYALLEENQFQIIGEDYLRIEMNLMSLEGQKISNLEEVHSHPIALLQCKEFFKNYPKIKLVEINDTADGAKKLKETNTKNIGIIASKMAADLYGLELLAEGIETNKQNYTRFLILSNQKQTIEEANKASIVFSLKHQVGSLVDILMILKCHELNMTSIQSSPIIGSPYEYNFHVDLNWSNRQYFDAAMEILTRNVAHLNILGIYKGGQYQN